MLPEIEVDEVKPAAPQQPKINVKIEKSAASTEDNKNMYKMYAEKLSKTGKLCLCDDVTCPHSYISKLRVYNMFHL